MGVGFQFFGAIAILIGYWIIALPMSYYFVFKLNYGLTGIWMGPVIAAIFLIVVFLARIFTIDWN